MTGNEWVTPGAEVLLYCSLLADAGLRAVRTTIAEVAGDSFTVAAEAEPNFPTARAESQRGGPLSVQRGGPRGSTRYCVPIDSDEARQILAEVHRRAVEHLSAVDGWT